MYKLLETYLTVITKKGKTHSLLYNMLLINILINELIQVDTIITQFPDNLLWNVHMLTGV